MTDDARPDREEIPDPGHFMPKPHVGATLVQHITTMMQAL
jgi:hypothetical protein